jgi:hypothetical protein
VPRNCAKKRIAEAPSHNETHAAIHEEGPLGEKCMPLGPSDGDSLEKVPETSTAEASLIGWPKLGTPLCGTLLLVSPLASIDLAIG